MRCVMPPDDYPGAASKHVLDGEALLAAGRFDGAGYLAGYAVECAITTVAQVEGMCYAAMILAASAAVLWRCWRCRPVARPVT